MIYFLSGCNNAFLGSTLGIFKGLLSIIQICGPILLILSLVYTFVKLMQNPEDKKLINRLKNSCLALALIFFIPLLVNVLLNMVDETSSFGACWKSAGSSGFGNSNYIEVNNDNDRVNIIGNSDYEQGVPSSSDNGNSSSGTTTSSGGDNTSITTPIVDNGGSRVIFIGDSRTVQMYSYVANTWKNNSYSTGGITQFNNDLFVAQGSMGLSWMKETGIPAAKQYFTNGVSIVILMGVNDLRNQDSYIEYLNSNVSSWTSKGAKLYFVTVNPCDGSYDHMNSRINEFNSKLKSNLSNKIGWINTHDNLSFKTVDGLHYNKDTSIKIYNYIKNKV